jgi:hypothetical protein
VPRDREYEEAFLDQAERKSGLMGLGFPEQVLERLDRVGARHGNRFESMGLRRLVAEIREEGLDVGGWSALAGQVALRSHELDVDQRLEVAMLLEGIAAYGVRVERLVRRLVELVTE